MRENYDKVVKFTYFNCYWGKKGKKYQLLDSEKKPIVDILFDRIENEHFIDENGWCLVVVGGKSNFICLKGNNKLLSDEWFDDCNVFYNGFGSVKKKGKWNYINTEGKIISKQWFDSVSDFKEEGFGIVENDEKYNFINRYGKLILNKWVYKIEIDDEECLYIEDEDSFYDKLD